MNDSISLPIKAIYYFAEETILLEFEKNSYPYNYQSGQYAMLSVVIDGKEVSRAYSFSSSPLVDGTIAFAIRKIANGEFSDYMFHHAKPGMMVTLSAPSGSFLLPAYKGNRQLVFFAAGSGITPIFSIIKTALFAEKDTAVSLIYSNKNRTRIIFDKELRLLQRQFADRLKIYHVLSDASDADEEFEVFYEGRVSPLVIKILFSIIQKNNNLESDFFICGPTEYIKLIEEAVIQLGVVSSVINKEFFYVPFKELTSYSCVEKCDVIIEWGLGTMMAEIKPAESLLDAALDMGMNVPHSCRQGTCGKCFALLVEGKVDMKVNYALTEEELEKGMILLCQSYPASDKIAITNLDY